MHKATMVLVAVAVAAGAVAGEAAPQAPETRRIGVVFIQQVFQNYQYARDTETQLKAKFQPDQQKIEAEIQRLQEMERNLQNNPILAPQTPAWRKKMMEIETVRVEIQAMQEDFAKRVREEEAAFWQNLYKAFQNACKIIAEYYQYDIIIATPDTALSEESLRTSDPMAIQQEILMRRIQYVNDRANLTKSITDLLNHRYQQYQQNPQAGL